jgi:hypothetical protein
VNPAAPDTTPPYVHAYPSRGKHGHTLKLRFLVNDDSGQVAIALGVYRASRAVATRTYPLGCLLGQLLLGLEACQEGQLPVLRPRTGRRREPQRGQLRASTNLLTPSP